MGLRDRWQRQETFGGWCGIPSAYTAELLAHAGFDWICVDMQHGLIGYEQMVSMLQGIAAAGMPSLVRVRWNRPDEIMRALDAGADGIIVPLVDSWAEAEAAARACRYPPDGERSWGPVRAALGKPGFGTESANRDVVCIVMVETPHGLEQVDAIAATTGVDGIFVGPNDLGISLGLGRPPLSGEAAEAHERATTAIADACRRHEIVAGISAYVDVEGSVARGRKAGYTMFSLSSDGALLAGAARAELALVRPPA